MTDETLNLFERIYQKDYGEEWTVIDYVDRHLPHVSQGIREVLQDAPDDYDELLRGRLSGECEGLYPTEVPICAMKKGDKAGVHTIHAKCDDQHNLGFQSDAYKGKAHIRVMRPEDFLYKAGDLGSQASYSAGVIVTLADTMRQCKKVNTPFLDVDLERCQVTSHEGRHRALGAVMAGVKKMPVIIYHQEIGSAKEQACLRRMNFKKEE